MLQSENGWPEPKENLHIRILTHKETATHSIDYTEDGILAITTNPNALDTMPEYVQRSGREPGCAALNQAGIDALWEALREIKLTAS